MTFLYFLTLFWPLFWSFWRGFLNFLWPKKGSKCTQNQKSSAKKVTKKIQKSPSKWSKKWSKKCLISRVIRIKFRIFNFQHFKSNVQIFKNFSNFPNFQKKSNVQIFKKFSNFPNFQKKSFSFKMIFIAVFKTFKF